MDEVRERLKQQCAYKPSLEINFVMSRDSKIACFWGKQFYITDDSFTPELVYETESFVNAASISDGSRYAVCQTAHNARNDEDSGTFAVIDVLHKKVLGKYHTEHGWKYMTHLYVDEREKCFWAYFGDDKEKVSFADRVKEEPSPEQKPEQPKKENPAAEPSKKQNKKANIIAIAVAVFFAFMLFGGFDLIAPRKRTTSTTRVSTPETNRSVLEETALNALDKESAAYISSIDAFYYSGKYTLTRFLWRPVSPDSGGANGAGSVRQSGRAWYHAFGVQGRGVQRGQQQQGGKHDTLEKRRWCNRNLHRRHRQQPVHRDRCYRREAGGNREMTQQVTKASCGDPQSVTVDRRQTLRPDHKSPKSRPRSRARDVLRLNAGENTPKSYRQMASKLKSACGRRPTGR